MLACSWRSEVYNGNGGAIFTRCLRDATVIVEGRPFCQEHDPRKRPINNEAQRRFRKAHEPRMLYRIRNKDGLYYSSGRSARDRWNGTGKWLTKQALGKALDSMSELTLENIKAIESWEAAYITDENFQFTRTEGEQEE